MRHLLNFDCNGAALAATMDGGSSKSGLLIVSGGNEVRSGAHRGMAMLAHKVAAAGHPVMRFDRRGVGDSEGNNAGYLSARDDIVAAIAAFRDACPMMTKLVAFGNCDAASALALHQPLAVDALVLANPWTIEQAVDSVSGDPNESAIALPPASAIRARYWQRLRDPASFMRLLRGEINLRKMAIGLWHVAAARWAPSPDSLGSRVVAAIGSAAQPVTVLLAQQDRTAQQFMAHWDGRVFPHIMCKTLDSGSHSFAGDDANWLTEQLLVALKDAAPTP